MYLAPFAMFDSKEKNDNACLCEKEVGSYVQDVIPDEKVCALNN